jgi:uncharacterized protein YjbI with pentapeptide repeats
MANPKHLEILKKGTDAWNQFHTNRQDRSRAARQLSMSRLRENPYLAEAYNYQADLRKADLSGMNLQNVSLVGVDLIGADLSGASLRVADLRWADLSEAQLRKADLRGADLRMANFKRSNLKGADLMYASLDETDLRESDLTHAILDHTIFSNIDLREVKGLETVTHHGPSTIGIDTVYQSQGKIPEIFLRGAGVPDHFIGYMRSLKGKTLEYYSCFIAYSSKDQEFANGLYEGLQIGGVRCWFAPHDIQAGKKVHEQIDTAIRLHERLLLILSPSSINSEWVKTEIANAREREAKEGRRILFPIRLNISFEQLQKWECFDADRGKDSAREVREYYIPDFTNWKDHDQYRSEFQKLLRDLKKETDLAAAAGSNE